MNSNRGFDNRQTDFWKIAGDPRAYRTCGIQSLHHARLLLGQYSDQGDLFAVPGQLKNYFSGHYLHQIKAVCKKRSVKYRDITNTNLRILRRDLDLHLKRGCPIILGSIPAEHWLVVAGLDEAGEYLLIDSADEPLVGPWDWEEMKKWLLGDENDPGPYEALAILPSKPELCRRSMVPNMAAIAGELASNRDLASEWGLYLQELDSVFNFVTMSGSETSAGDFLEANEEPIVQSVLWSDPDLNEKVVRRVYENFRIVGSAHNLSLPAACEAHAVAQMAILLKESVD